jgi:hypothetical protein
MEEELGDATLTPLSKAKDGVGFSSVAEDWDLRGAPNARRAPSNAREDFAPPVPPNLSRAASNDDEEYSVAPSPPSLQSLSPPPRLSLLMLQPTSTS